MLSEILDFNNPKYYPYGKTDLVLSKQGLTDNEIPSLVLFLSEHPEITRLDLIRGDIGDAGAIALAANTTLTHLNMSRNSIGDKGAIALATNTTLTALCLIGNAIGDEGAIALAANTTLTTLDLSQNDIGFDGAVALAHNTTFTKFKFNGGGDHDNLSFGWNKGMSKTVTDALTETNLIKRFIYTAALGIKLPFPSLQKLCIHSARKFLQNGQIEPDEIEKLPYILKRKIIAPKV